MMHDPCGELNELSSCMVKDAFGKSVCSKKFSKKKYQPSTVTRDDGYPIYRRRMDGRSHQVRIKDSDNQYHDYYHMTNSLVVPYNPYLSKKYNAHINVEVCASVKAIKYINKYIYKGSDQTTLKTIIEQGAATAATNSNDEVAKYLSGRYISPVKAAWRLLEFPIHEESPSVTPLIIHLENEQPVSFDPSSREEIIQKMNNSQTTLIAYSQYNYLNQDRPDFQPLLYQQFPEHMAWKQQAKMWKPRVNKRFSIGRVYYCSPAAGERYFLRLLLTVVNGATSFEHLETVDGRVCGILMWRQGNYL